VTAASGLYMSMPSADKKVLLNGVKSGIKLHVMGALNEMILGA